MQESISHRIANIASKSKTDEIYIVGKGPSLDELGKLPTLNGIVINLNDSERILAGHIAIFSANWVRHSLAESGFRCDYYLAGKPLPANISHDVLPPLPLELDQDDLSTYRLGHSELYDESFVLITALKVCQQVAATRGRRQTVYLLGLDFSTVGGAVSASLGRDYTIAPIAEREVIVHAQESHFRQFKSYLEGRGQIQLIHVGHKDFSRLTPSAFLRERNASTTQSNKVRRPNGVQIVAELTNNHLGDRKRLIEMVERSKAAGADLIKIQKRDVNTFYTSEQLQSHYTSPFGKTLGDYRNGVELTDELLDILDDTCRNCGIDWFCSVLDYPSYESLLRFSPKLLKVPSTISNHKGFHAKLAANYHGSLVVSTGYTGPDYVQYVIDTFAANELIYLLHCISAYPTPRNDCNIAVVSAYAELAKRHPQIVPGYSSHDLGSVGCMLAVASGARMLEKHVKLGDVEWVHFDKVAIDLKTDSFATFVQDIRMAEEVIGSPVKRILDCEHHKYPVANRL